MGHSVFSAVLAWLALSAVVCEGACSSTAIDSIIPSTATWSCPTPTSDWDNVVTEIECGAGKKVDPGSDMACYETAYYRECKCNKPHTLVNGTKTPGCTVSSDQDESNNIPTHYINEFYSGSTCDHVETHGEAKIVLATKAAYAEFVTQRDSNVESSRILFSRDTGVKKRRNRKLLGGGDLNVNVGPATTPTPAPVAAAPAPTPVAAATTTTTTTTTNSDLPTCASVCKTKNLEDEECYCTTGCQCPLFGQWQGHADMLASDDNWNMLEPKIKAAVRESPFFAEGSVTFHEVSVSKRVQLK